MSKACVGIDKRFLRSKAIDERIYSAFVEHLGNVIYGGIYSPKHPTANADGFRKDTIELVKALHLPVIRYPGGNFICGYRWEDTVGPVNERPVRADLAWCQREPNTVGIAEFSRWCRDIGSTLGMAVNMSTRGAVDAANLVEYCNHPEGTYYADLRRANGDPEPFGVKLWFVGNEVDGPWNIGMKRAADYAWDAAEAAKAMRKMDDDIELVAVGSSGTQLDTYLEWDRTVLEKVYDCCDYISLHRYMGHPDIDTQDTYDFHDTGDYLALAERLDQNIRDVIAACDYVKGLKHSKKDMYISMDEYNVMEMDAQQREEGHHHGEPWQIGAEGRTHGMSMRAALLFGLSMLTLLKHSDRIRIACQSILINGNGLVVSEDGSDAWVNISYYIFRDCSLFGRGKVLESVWDCDVHDTATCKAVAATDGVCVYHEDTKELDLFVVNKTDGEVTLTIDAERFGELTPIEHIELAADDLAAHNSAEHPDAVAPVSRQDLCLTDHGMCVKLAAYSWNVIRIKES